MYFEDLPRTVGFFFTFAAQVLEKIGSADNKNGSEFAPGYIANDPNKEILMFLKCLAKN